VKQSVRTQDALAICDATITSCK